jgi:Fe-S-cluster containining protein
MADLTCDGCGACCMYFMIRLSKPLGTDEARWYELHGVKVRSNGLLFNIPCQEFDMETRKCKIYEKRPECCKAARVGAPNCLFSRQHMKGMGVKISEG